MSAAGTMHNERTLSGALALAMHVLFFILLVFGVSWQRKPEAPVMADLWSSLPPLPQPKVEPPPEEPVPPEPAPKPVPKVETPPPPKVEPKPVIKPEIALKKKAEKEKKKEKEPPKAEPKKHEDDKAKIDEKAKIDKEKLAKEAEAKKKREEDAVRKERELKQFIAEKDADAKAAAARASAQAKAMDAYMHGIREKIRRNIILPQNMQGNPEAQFDVVQIPGGEVLDVKLKRGSGVTAYDEAVERAIRKASPLPPPPAGTVFSDVRELNLKFRPQE